MASYEGQITLINVDDGVGTPGPTYVIDTNQDEILRFANEDGYSFSPSELDFQIRKISEDSSEVLEVGLEDVALYIYQQGEWHLIEWDSIQDCISLGESNDFTLNISKLAEGEGALSAIAQLLKTEETALRIQFYINRVLVGSKIIGVRYGLSSDMAQLSLSANGIVASIQKAGLVFDSNGLTVRNGAFNIKTNQYIQEGQITSFDPETDYYIYTLNGYQLVDKTHGPVAGQEYFIRKEELVLMANEHGDLVISGIIKAKDGQFSGEVYATNGRFNGEVNAKNGSFSGSIDVLGQLAIGEEKKIYIGKQSKEGQNLQGIFSDGFLTSEEEGFYLGSDGTIIANTIQLGESASIKNFLKVGDNCYLYNPLSNAGRFISVKDKINPEIEVASLSEDGIFRIGNDGIVLDGPKRAIYTNNFISGGAGWSITPDKAEFNNIVARGTIESSVFAHGKVQTIGGTLLVRPSTIIKSYQPIEGGGYIILPETLNAGFNRGDYCQIGALGTLYLVTNIDELTGKITLVPAMEAITLQDPIELTKEEEVTFSINGEILISYGQPTEGKENIGIAINSSASSSFAAPNAISIFKNSFYSENGEIKLLKEPVIILGEMGDSNYGGLKGYGLYADNVYLKGSLISEGGEDRQFYSGVNTQSKTLMPEGDSGIDFFPGKPRGNILFWAGATSSDDADIANAPFKVDSYGNLYAGSGFFNGTIISNASITAARIKTAIIEGWSLEANSQAALTIIDAAKAINFSRKNAQENYESIMSLDENEMRLTVPLELGIIGEDNEFIPKIKFDGKDGSLQFEKFFVEDAQGNTAEVGVSSLTFLKYEGSSSSLVKTVIKANRMIEPNLQFHVLGQEVAEGEDSQVLKLTKERATFSGAISCASDLMLGETIEYRQTVDENDAIIGYDLYVKE